MKKQSIIFKILICAAGIVFLLPPAHAADYYVAPKSGNDQNSGAKDAPFRSIKRAVKEVAGVGGTIHLTPNEGFYKEQILLQDGGTAEQRLIIEGNGATINLGTDVTTGPWTMLSEGEYRLEQKAPKHTRHYVTAPIFINGLPVWAPHAAGKGIAAWHGGQLRQDEEDRFIVKFPEGLTPENSIIIMTSRDFQAGLQCNGGSHITVRNLTICFVGNDGFNFHNHVRDAVLENVKALFNGDQGISSHETCEVAVKGAEFAFNGSVSGGVVDINEAKTTYTDVIVHHNRNYGFMLNGAQHKLEGVISYGHQLSNLPKASDTVAIANSQDLGTKTQDQTVNLIPRGYPINQSTEVDRDDIIARSYELRPME